MTASVIASSDFHYDVILCSYNGGEYISEQLTSIVTQSIQPQKVVLSDDGSTDNTISIAERFMREYSEIELIIIKGPGFGPSANFLSALKYITSEYVFFSDQDDVWERHKVSSYEKYIKLHSKCKAQLYFSDSLLVDKSLKPIGKTHLEFLGVRPDEKAKSSILFSNYVQGATICLNNELVSLLRTDIERHGFSGIVIHDWWCALVAFKFGELIFINKPLIKYRQHDNNVIGCARRPIFGKKMLSMFLKFKQLIRLFAFSV
ncbi:glycosyltransferase family 2 protein [Vibrio pacinii]|uniref:glycosyltransferase family 2 protein n=1 Tax=Vibrio pacinii TaxID=170674 RepID=UPI00069180E1|nr:glycosyltransferase family 2 protein [Vibrio pacinii]